MSAEHPTSCIFLDHASTTPLSPAVLDAMLPYLKGRFGNPSSAHRLGEEARDAIEHAREVIARSVGASPEQLIFTSGGTEADNMGVRMAQFRRQPCGSTVGDPGKRIIISSIEHPAVRDTSSSLRQDGFDVLEAPVSSDGIVDLAWLGSYLDSSIGLCALMHVNNEIGTIQPVEEVSCLCRKKGVPFFADCVQSFSKLAVSLPKLGASAISLSAHKIGGPKGIGAFISTPDAPRSKLLFGGDQEFGSRAGTPSVANIVGFARAVELNLPIDPDRIAQVTRLRDHLIDGILESIPRSSLNGSRTRRVCNNANISFDKVEGRALLEYLDQHGVCASLGSACSSASLDPSHVLTAIGLPADRALGSLRFTLGFETTQEEIDAAIGFIQEGVNKLRPG